MEDFIKPTRCSKVYEQKYKFQQEPIEDRTEIKIGKYMFLCIHTPGHTKGHTCLWFPEKNMLFAGNLLDMTKLPVFEIWEKEKTVYSILNSLGRIKELPNVKTVYGSHDISSERYLEKVEKAVVRCYMTMLEIYQLVNKYPGCTTYELSLKRRQMIKEERKVL